MNFTKIFTLVVLTLFLGFFGCSKEQKAEAPTQEHVEKNLTPPKAEITGQNFSVQINDLKYATTVDLASKDFVETPSLRGDITITNRSKDILDIQAVTLEYLDEAGNPIPFKSGEKISRVSSYWKAIKPGESYQGSIDATIPTAAIKEKTLKKIEINLVYIPSPLKRETLTLPEKVE